MTYLNFNDLCRKFGGRSRTTIYRDVAAGRLPKPLKIGGRLYWDAAKIEASLAELQDRS